MIYTFYMHVDLFKQLCSRISISHAFITEGAQLAPQTPLLAHMEVNQYDLKKVGTGFLYLLNTE